MYCSNCGHELTTDAAYCGHCGLPRTLAAPASSADFGPAGLPVATERDVDGIAAFEQRLRAGELPPSVICPQRLTRGEQAFSTLPADVWQYASRNVQYSRGGVVSFANPVLLGATVAGSLLYNKAQKDRAVEASRAQWRLLGRMTVTFTSQRLAVDDAAGYSDFPWARLTSVHLAGTRLLVKYETKPWLAFDVERPRWHQVLALYLSGLLTQPETSTTR